MITKKSLLLSFLFLIITNSFAFNYTITFTGVSTRVSNVKVQNLTKDPTVSVPDRNLLNLTARPTDVDKLNDYKESVRIYPNPIQSTATLPSLPITTATPP